jgi:hypothetical protein
MVMINDPGGAQTRMLGTEQVPETYIIGPDGRIVARFQSDRAWDSAESKRLIRALQSNTRSQFQAAAAAATPRSDSS